MSRKLNLFHPDLRLTEFARKVSNAIASSTLGNSNVFIYRLLVFFFGEFKCQSESH